VTDRLTDHATRSLTIGGAHSEAELCIVYGYNKYLVKQSFQIHRACLSFIQHNIRVFGSLRKSIVVAVTLHSLTKIGAVVSIICKFIFALGLKILIHAQNRYLGQYNPIMGNSINATL